VLFTNNIAPVRSKKLLGAPSVQRAHAFCILSCQITYQCKSLVNRETAFHVHLVYAITTFCTECPWTMPLHTGTQHVYIVHSKFCFYSWIVNSAKEQTLMTFSGRIQMNTNSSTPACLPLRHEARYCKLRESICALALVIDQSLLV